MALSNVVTISGATLINRYARNYPYTSAPANMPILTEIIFSDLQVLGFKDSLNNLKKCLCDASGSSATSQYRVFFANASGEADSSADLYFQSSELYVQGEMVHHGSPSSYTLTNGGHTAVIALSAGGVLNITLDGVEQVNWTNGGPD